MVLELEFKELFIFKPSIKSPESFESILEIRWKQCHNNSSFSFIQNIQSLLKIYPTIHLFGHIPTVKPYCSYPELRNQMKTQFRISGTQNTHLMFYPIISNHSQSHNPIQIKCVEMIILNCLIISLFQVIEQNPSIHIYSSRIS